MVVGAAFGVGFGDLGDGGDVDGFVELAVAAAVEPVAHDSAAAGFDGGGAVGHREAGFGREPGRVAGFSEDLRGH